MRKAVFGIVFAMVALLGAYGTVAAAPVQTSKAKVVIIVGADTPQYITDANQVYAEAIKYTPNVKKVYSPNATWSAVKARRTAPTSSSTWATATAVPSPYPQQPDFTKNGFGLNTKAGAAGNNNDLLR